VRILVDSLFRERERERERKEKETVACKSRGYLIIIAD
jgi:hypothetical protein